MQISDMEDKVEGVVHCGCESGCSMVVRKWETFVAKVVLVVIVKTRVWLLNSIETSM